MNDFFAIYDMLIAGVASGETVTDTCIGSCWTAVETAGRFGMAMTTPVDTAPRMLTGEYTGMALKELATAAKSWNLTESSYGMAAVNAWYNTPEALERQGAYEPFDKYCTDGLDLRGKKIGVVGHLNMPVSVYEQAESVRILERNPRPGDYPDSACDWLIPQCDVVIMTASTLVNKTLPHLLDLSRNAYTILAGPSCPMCPGLLEFGIDRIAGLIVTDVAGMKHKILADISGPPYPMGKPFLLTRDRL